jgi:bacitracin transport system ATP-binding protein
MADTIGIIDHGRLLEELSMNEIKRRNRHYVKMTVSDIGRAVPVLEKELNITDFESISEREIKIYQIDLNFEEVNRRLNNAGVGVSEISLNKGNLEEYFLKLTGGGLIG